MHGSQSYDTNHFEILAIMLLSPLILLSSLASVASCSSNQECYAIAASIVANMSVQAMVGQMVQLDIGQVLNDDLSLNEQKVRGFAALGVGSYLNSPFAGGPHHQKYGWTAQEWRRIISKIQEIHTQVSGHPIIYGLDSVHGANYVTNSVLFPHQLNAAASFNRKLVNAMGYYTGRDTEAAGIPWVFGPILDVASHKAWPRTFETFGEDPYVVTQMAKEIVHGLQDNNTIAACFKHFIGYAATPTGHDRDPLVLTDYSILNYYMPPFQAAIDAGALTGMMNYVSLNGIPMGVNHKMLVELLREQLQFKGMLVTDWAVIDDLTAFHKVAANEKEAVAMAMKQTSIDMSMDATHTRFISNALALIRAGELTLERIQESATRIIALKHRLKLYQEPMPGKDKVNRVGDDQSKQAALQLARESIVLLKNVDNSLPLPLKTTIFLTGPSIDNIGHLCGGWSLHWQGACGNSMFLHGKSIAQALKADVAMPMFTKNGTFMEDNLELALAAATKAKYTIAVMGEGHYAEKPGDINDLLLPKEQLEYIRALAKTDTKLVLVLVQGRPRLLDGVADLVHAVIYAGLPCEMGGEAIADVLRGAVNPSAKLPFSYPRHPLTANVVYYHRQNQGCLDDKFHFGECKFEWPFGTGLSYTTFLYKDFQAKIVKNELHAKFTIKNIGSYEGKETILLFYRQQYRTKQVPEMKRLIYFQKISLKPKEAKNFNVIVPLDEFGSYMHQLGDTLKKTPIGGPFTLMLSTTEDCKASPDHCIEINESLIEKSPSKQVYMIDHMTAQA
uniref:beta-glucosidase n=1 Tax=Thraustotheca clavata TaxID=74557 RepID=A0A0A7CMA1_9STRA|nr:secreted protein [Thraustotheca clavata]